MTVGAGARWYGVQSGERKPGAVVVEIRVRPVAGVMALLAGLWEVRSRVVRICGSLEICKVARNARVRGQIEIVVDVAIGANTRRHRMHAGQREVYRGVVESHRRPAPRGVAGVARC